MLFNGLVFFGLHLAHWLLAALLPLSLTAFALVCLIRASRITHRVCRDINPTTHKIEDLNGRSIKNVPLIDGYFQESRLPAIRMAFAKLRQDGQDLYQGLWLPDPSKDLNPESLLRPSELLCMTFLPAGILIAAGIVGSLAEMLVQHWFATPAGLELPLILLPGLVGLAGAVLTGVSVRHAARVMQSALQSLWHSLERRVPIYSDQAGIALLIDNFHDYDRDMKDTLQQFTATAGRLAESDMADGIRRSIEQVLLDSVAPSVQQATNALGCLAGEIASRQERGMQDLAVRFASALSTEIASNLQPVNREITQMGALMADVRNYIEYAMRALETVRQQSSGLLTDTRESLGVMSAARSQLTEDFGQVDQKLQQLVSSTAEMAAVYQGSGQSLSANVQELGRQIEQYNQNLGQMNHEAVQALQVARLEVSAQQDTAGQYLGIMQDQVSQLNGQFSAAIKELLQEIRAEAATIAAHTGALGSQLSTLNDALERSLAGFTQASSQYVRQAISGLDGSLAELTGRIAGTAAELRDAVDALPLSLRQVVMDAKTAKHNDR